MAEMNVECSDYAHWQLASPFVAPVLARFSSRERIGIKRSVQGNICSKIISYLIVHFDWRTVFLIYAFVVLLCVPCGALYRPIEFEPIYDETAEDDDANKRDVKSEKREPIKVSLF